MNFNFDQIDHPFTKKRNSFEFEREPQACFALSLMSFTCKNKIRLMILKFSQNSPLSSPMYFLLFLKNLNCSLIDYRKCQNHSKACFSSDNDHLHLADSSNVCININPTLIKTKRIQRFVFMAKFNIILFLQIFNMQILVKIDYGHKSESKAMDMKTCTI